MISWPGHMSAGRNANIAQSIDLFPTIAAAAGLKSPTGLPGINLLDDEALTSRHVVFGVCSAVHNMTVGDPDDTLKYLWCIEGDWKLLLRYQGKDTTQYRNLHIWDTAPFHLYNLKKDPHEKNDLAAVHPELIDRLKKKIEAWHRVKK